jgi:succinoglycan biosynthesis transport protein ExoP
MERKPPSSIGDIVAVISRRKYWIGIPFVVVVAAGIALSPYIPRSYRSTTTITVTSPDSQSPLLRPSSVAQTTARIQDIGLEITTGGGMLEILNKLNLYPQLRQQGKTNQILAQMRRDTTVAEVPDTGDNRGNVGAFTISYIGDSPEHAQAVTHELANFFVNENLTQSHHSTQGTDSFLSAQVAAAGQQLATQQAKIQAFKNAHLGSLPEQAQANLGMIAQYQTQLQSNSAALDQDNQQRVYLQSVLNVSPGTAQNSAAAPEAMTPLEIELAQKQSELHADLLKYTPEHPDVIRLQHDITALKFQIHHTPKTSAAAAFSPQMPQTSGPSVHDQLRSQLLALNADIKSRQARGRQIDAELARLQGSFGALPAVQTQFASLDSDYQEMQKNYNILLEKQKEAAMAVALDQQNPEGQLTVLQPANFPAVPYRPEPVLLHMIIVLIALLAGLVFGLIVELRDDTMHTTEEVADYLKLPVIIAFPKCAPLAAGGKK